MLTDALAGLAGELDDGLLVTDPQVVAAHAGDQVPGLGSGTPLALVRPRTTQDVATVLRWASAHGVPVVPRGAGSGLAGAANAVDGAVVVSLAAMDRVLEVNPADRYVVVQPGAVTAAVDAAARAHGLSYPPDPASKDFSTIGGNIATNAGGLCCVKYGVTADFVLALEVVLADGSIVRTGHRTRKGVAGYDLTHLMVGSEGTLGVVTEATLRLVPAPLAAATLVAFFPTLESAGEAVAAIAADGLGPSLLEIMDATTIRVVDEAHRMDLDRDAAALVLAQCDTGPRAAEDIAELAVRCEAAGAGFVASTDDPAEGEALLAARRAAYPSLERLGATLLDDVCVPVSALPAAIAAIEAIAERYELLIGTFGHAGDGSLHPTIVHDATSADRAAKAFDDILTAALELGGTITGEHGVGRLKAHRLADELGPAGIRLQHAVKAAFDPAGILNPGAVLPPLP